MSSTVRSATVRLEADVAAYIAKMEAAGKATDDAFKRSHGSAVQTSKDFDKVTTRARELSTTSSRLERNLTKTAQSFDELSTSVTRLGRETRSTSTTQTKLSDDVMRTERSLKRGQKGLDSYTDRLGLLASAVAAVGPALGPLGAVSIGGMLGLANQAGMATIAAGSLVVAFQGVGTTLKAVQKAAIEPTAENLAAAREAMQQLSPAARTFVRDFQAIRPVLQGIQASAASGWFPGLDQAMRNLLPLAPVIERIFHDVGKAGGDLLAKGAKSLAGPQWADFFAFVDREAPKAMAALGKVVGSLAHGLAQLWMAFEPANTSFNRWMVDAARSFDAWATGLSKTQGFHEFIDYLQSNGPKVADALAAIGNAVLQIVEAAAPLGGPTLEAITAIANAIAKIADSPLGTPILLITQLAGALSLYRKALGGIGGSKGGLLGGLMVGPNMDKLNAGLKQMRSSISYLGSGGLSYFGSGLRQVGGQALRAAGPILGLAAAQSSFVKQAGLSNTAMFTGLGMMAGPWGGAIGAATGLLTDEVSAIQNVNSASDSAADALDRLSQANRRIGSSSIDLSQGMKEAADSTASLKNVTDLRAAGARGDVLATYGHALQSIFTNPGESTAILAKGLFGIGDGMSDAEKNAAALNAAMERLHRTAYGIAAFFKTPDLTGNFPEDLGKLQGVMDTLQPAMRNLGITTEQLQEDYSAQSFNKIASAFDLLGHGSRPFTDDMKRLRTEVARLDSTSGQIDGVGKAIKSMSNPMITSAQSAQQLSQALGALFDPKLGANAAADSWVKAGQALKGIKAASGFDLKGPGGLGTSKATLENRSLVQQYVAAMKDKITADAAAGASEQRLKRDLVQSQRVLKRNSTAALAYGRQLGLTPKLVRTVIKQVNAEKARAEARKLAKQYLAFPTEVKTKLKAEDIPQTRAAAVKMAKDLDLVGKPRQAFIKFAGDAAKQGIKTVDDLLSKVNKKKTNPKVTVDGAQAVSVISTVGGMLASLNGRVAKTYIQTIRTGGGGGSSVGASVGGVIGSADGGTVPKTGLPYADRHVYLLADGEEVISNRRGQADRHRGLLKAINAGRLADGGTATTSRSQHPATPWMTGGPWVTQHQIAIWGELHLKVAKLKDHLDDATKALDKEKEARSKLLDKMHTLSSDVQGGLKSELFGEVDPWTSKTASTSPSGVMATLRSDTAHGRQELAAIRQLKKKGVSGDALAAILSQGGLAGAQEFAKMSRSDLAQYERLYRTRDRVLHSVGDLAGRAAYGRQLGQENRQISELAATVHRIEHAIKEADRHNRHGHKDTKDTVKGATSSAGRHNGRRN